jgi:voltage-gated potassium channel
MAIGSFLSSTMLFPVIISLAIIFTTILIHGAGTIWMVKILFRKTLVKGQSIKMFEALYGLSMTAVFLMLLHFAEVILWAMAYLLLTELPQLSTFEEAIYFSLTTYTTLGYGDITLGDHWRIMSGFEAMNGIMLFGWSTAMLFSVVQKILELIQPSSGKSATSNSGKTNR